MKNMNLFSKKWQGYSSAIIRYKQFIFFAFFLLNTTSTFADFKLQSECDLILSASSASLHERFYSAHESEILQSYANAYQSLPENSITPFFNNTQTRSTWKHLKPKNDFIHLIHAPKHIQEVQFSNSMDPILKSLIKNSKHIRFEQNEALLNYAFGSVGASAKDHYGVMLDSQNTEIIKQYQNFLYLSDGKNHTLGRSTLFRNPKANITSSDIENTGFSLTQQKFNVITQDNTEAFQVKNQHYDLIVGKKILCRCKPGHHTCGGLNQDSFRFFIRELISKLDINNPKSSIILNPGPENSHDFKIWDKILEEETLSHQMDFRYTLSITGKIPSIIIKPKNSFESPEFLALLDQTLPKAQ